MNEPHSLDSTPGGRIGEILRNALSQPTTEAPESYLVDVCGDDAELRTQGESLLAAGAEAGDFLEQTVMGDPSEPLTEGPGAVIGRYKLLEKIGEGGFGAVDGPPNSTAPPPVVIGNAQQRDAQPYKSMKASVMFADAAP